MSRAGNAARWRAPLLILLAAVDLAACRAAVVSPAPPVASPPVHAAQPLPYAAKWETFAMAQAASWLDPKTLAVGRWDGALTVFDVPDDPNAPIALAGVAANPARQGIEMIATVDRARFVTSNDGGSLAEWHFDRRTGLRVADTVSYDRDYGAANTGALVIRGERNWLVTGHANGRVLIWDAAARPLRLVRAVDVRSPNPVQAPGRALRNVRGLAVTADGLVIAGAEDGDLTVLHVPQGEILTRQRFNPDAQLGINAVTLVRDLLLVGNCAKGTSDRNLWLFRVEGATLTRLDSANLVQDDTRQQVFTFDVETADRAGEASFYASTEEGLVWGGRLEGDALRVLWRQPVDPGLGAALALRTGRLAAVGYNLRVFDLP